MLNAYPFTVSPGSRRRTGAGLHGLVNKYAAGSFNGYQVFFENGHLCAWLFRSSTNFIHDGTGCTMRTSGVNDGAWHQVAFVADASGGKLYVDGALKAVQPWTGPAGSHQAKGVGGPSPRDGVEQTRPAALTHVRTDDWALSAADVAQIHDEMPPLP